MTARLEENLRIFEMDAVKMASLARRTSLKVTDNEGWFRIFTSDNALKRHDVYIAYITDPKGEVHDRWNLKVEINGQTHIQYQSEGLLSMLSNITTKRWDQDLILVTSDAVKFLNTKIVGRKRTLNFK